jgi:hypothetical protein
MENSWKSATMSAFLPSGTSDILTDISSLLSTVTTVLGVVSSALDTASTFLKSLSILDLLSTLRTVLEQYKSDLEMSGIYMCSMLDYPIRQLTKQTSYGPTADYTSVFKGGTDFSDTFIQDLCDSFKDTNDPNRPKFYTDCAMLVLVAGTGNYGDITLDFNNPFIDIFSGLADNVRGMIGDVKILSHRLDLAATIDLAAKSDITTVADRVKRANRALMMYNSMTKEEKMSVLSVCDAISGTNYLNNIDSSRRLWEDALPMLESIEERYSAVSEYPDWNKISMRDIVPHVVQIIDLIFDPIIDMFGKGYDIATQITALINAIKGKITYLTNLTYQIQNIINMLDDLINATGFYAIFIDSQNGTSELITKLANASNIPFDKGFFTGFAILAGGPAYTPFKTMFSLIAG